MKRRQFIQSLLVGAASSGFAPAFAFTQTESWQQAFDQALLTNPRLLGFKGTTQDQLVAEAIELEGAIPNGLRGHLYRNGPAQHELGDYRYRHWFDGNGMVQSFAIDQRGIRHQGKMVATEKYLLERQANKPMFPTFGSVPPDVDSATSADQLNAANISMLAHHGELLALWEGGSAHVINPTNLATQGIKTWSKEAQGLPFSAHPRVDPDGTLWNFGYASSAGLLVLWHIDAEGKLQKNGIIPLDHMAMPHDFVVTENHLVIMLPPFHFEPGENSEGRSFLELHQWHDDRPTRVLVVKKSDFDDYQYVDLPAQWVFHFGNAWEDLDRVIRFDGASSQNPSVMQTTFREIMRGETITPSDHSQHYIYEVDTRKGKAKQTLLLPESVSTEFPVIDPRVCGRRYQRVFCLANTHGKTQDTQGPSIWFNSVMGINVETGAYDQYTYPTHHMPEEHLFVPAPNSAPESQGWVIGTSLDIQQKRTCLNVFDAQNLSAGPLARATLPYALPLGLHGKFLLQT